MTTITQVANTLQPQTRLPEGTHNSLLETNRRSYTALLLHPSISDQDAMEILVSLLAVTDNDGEAVTNEEKRLEDQVICTLLKRLPPAATLKGFSRIVGRRVNNHRCTTTVCSYIFGSPDLETLAVKHRGLVCRILRHAMGKRVTQTCVHFLTRDGELAPYQERYLRRHIDRYASRVHVAREVFLFAFRALDAPTLPQLLAYKEARERVGLGRGLPLQTLRSISHTYHGHQAKRYLKTLAKRDRVKREAALPTDEDRSLIANLRRCYLTPDNRSEVLAAIQEQIREELALVPQQLTKTVVIADMSQSMKGYGARLYNSTAIAVAAVELFRQRYNAETMGCNLTEGLPQPRGATAIGPMLIEALAKEPELIVVISDGYENQVRGDVHAILIAAGKLGCRSKVLQIIPTFTDREDISERTLSSEAAVVAQTGERGLLQFWLKVQHSLDPAAMIDQLEQCLSVFNARANVPAEQED